MDPLVNIQYALVRKLLPTSIALVGLDSRVYSHVAVQTALTAEFLVAHVTDVFLGLRLPHEHQVWQ